jgi:hypothetical protein
VEQRLAVLAGADAQAVSRHGASNARPARGLAGSRGAWLITAMLVASAGVADARPKRRDARAAFDRGLAAYKKGSFAAASAALSKSFELERDADTLFAWAQAERKLEHCDKALDLYDTVLGFDLPARNREAVERSIADCRAMIAAQQPEPPVVAPPPIVAPAPVAPPPVIARPPEPPPRSRAWYHDPVALGLVGTGLVAGGVGAGLLISARSLNNDSRDATTIDEARRLGDQAKSRGNLGLVTAGAGGALLIGGIVWIVLNRPSAEQRTIAGWLAPGGGGVSVTGAF